MTGRNLLLTFTIMFFAAHTLNSQILTGRITDNKNEPLYGVNIYVKNENIGVVSNMNGNYSLKLREGKFTIVYSFMGYESYSFDLEIANGEAIEKNVELTESEITLNDVVVFADPLSAAERVIIEVLKHKREYLSKLKNYSYRAYTKTVFRAIYRDTARIGGITETLSNGYFSYPNSFQEELISRKQTANFTDFNNIFTAGKIINVLEDELAVNEIAVISPLAENALSYYSYRMKDTTYYEGKKVFIINFEPTSNTLPLFRGEIGIIDETFAVVSANLFGDERINSMYIKNIEIRENLREFESYYWLPINVETKFNMDIGIPGFPKMPVSSASQISQYVLNADSFDHRFDNFSLVTKIAAPDEAKQLWVSEQIIPLDDDEKEAYVRIDSAMTNAGIVFKAFFGLFRLMPSINSLPLSSIDDFYHFNRVEGNYLGAGFNSLDYFGSANLRVSAGYGFDDKKAKWNVGIVQKLFDDKIKLSGNYYYKLDLLDSFNDYDIFDLTYQGIFYKNDYADYYYNKGLSFEIAYKPVSDFSISGSFKTEMHSASYNNTNWSMFYKDKFYNKSIFIESRKINTAGFGLSYSNRRYIDLGFATSPDYSRDFFSIEYDYELSSTDVLKSNVNYSRHVFSLSTNTKLPPFFNILFTAQFGYSSNKYVLENQFFIPGAYSTFGGANIFKTVDKEKYIGSKFAFIFFENNFRNTPFKILGIPFLKDSQYELILFFNAGFLDNRFYKDENFNTIELDKKPLMEGGFGIGNIFMFMRTDFSWRLNRKMWSNFTVTFTSSLSF